MVHAHYDVMTVDPINEWDSGPFGPKIVCEYVYTRDTSEREYK